MRIPAGQPPAGYTQNFENPELHHVNSGISITIFGMIVMTIFLMLRVYTKAFLVRSFGGEDVALIFAWAFSVALQSIVVYLWWEHYIGVHIWDLYVDEVKLAAKLITICRVLQLPSMALAKLALLSFYRKLSLARWFTFAVYSLMCFITSYSVALVLAIDFSCIPLKRTWDYTITEGSCIDRGAIYLSNAALNAATDVMLLILTLLMIWRLKVTLVQKIGMAAMFAIGSLTLVTSLVRLALLPAVIASKDPTWKVSTLARWTCVDANLIVICGCLPIMRLLFRHVAPRLIGEDSNHAHHTARGESRGKKSTPVIAELSILDSNRLKRLSARLSAQQDYNRMNELDEWEKDAGTENASETYTMDSTGRILPRTSIPSVPDDTPDWPLPGLRSEDRVSH